MATSRFDRITGNSTWGNMEENVRDFERELRAYDNDIREAEQRAPGSEELQALKYERDMLARVLEQAKQRLSRQQNSRAVASSNTAADAVVSSNRISKTSTPEIISRKDIDLNESFKSTGDFSVGTSTSNISANQKFKLDKLEKGTFELPNLSDLVSSPSLDLGDRIGSDGSFIDDADEVGPEDDPTYTGGSGQPPASYYPSANPLGIYSNYTYGLSLHVLDQASYQSMIDSPGSFRPTKTIIASSSRYKDTRLPEFTDDFYFDNLQVTTIIGLNSATRGTNSVMIKFNLIEPYGLTLMDRILDISVNELGVSNYLEIPYVLEINFFGYTDDGEPQKIENQTKFIPIRIANLGMRAKKTGSEYTVTAYAFNHLANLQSTQSVKANFEVVGRTVRDIFINDLDSESKTQVEKAADQSNKRAILAKESQERESNQQIDLRKAVDAGLSNTVNINSSAPPSATINSFTGAFNLFNFYEQAHGNIEVADEIRFEIHPDIAGATITDPEYTASGSTPVLDSQSSNSQSTASSPAKSGPDFTKTKLSVNAGTSIIDFVNDVITTSSYVTNQLKNSEKERKDKTGSVTRPEDLFSEESSSGAYVNWFKILPKIELTGFDKKRNRWGKRITFYVIPYAHYNTKDGRAPIANPPGAVKEYNFFYTGENTDVIDFDIQFDTLYYTAVHVSKSLMESLNNAPLANPNTLSGALEPQVQGSIAPVMKEITLGSHGGSLQGAALSSTKLNAMSFRDSVYSNAAGDMIELKLKINGDPEFIKQDEIFYHPGVITTSGNQFIENTGSLAMDDGEIFCRVRFRSPVDIDETTGLLRSDGRYTDSGFSGLYRIITVDNVFQKGQFTQTLTLIRQPNQENDIRNNNKITGESSQRSNDSNRDQAENSTVTDSNYLSFSNGSQVYVDTDSGTIFRTDAEGNVEQEQVGQEAAQTLVTDIEKSRLRATQNDVRELSGSGE